MAELLTPTRNGTRDSRIVTDPYIELGSTGLRQWGGYVHEEFLRAWQASRKAHTIKEMLTDSIVGVSLWVYDLLMRQVNWDIEPANEDQPSLDHAEFVKQCLFDDMSHTWTDTISEHLSMLPWGWSFAEVIYKQRRGDHRDPSKRSKFDDGKVGIRKIAPRSQDSLDRWEFGEGGEVLGFHQIDTYNGTHAYIPIEKALLFRTRSVKNSPEGTSLLRSAYIAWHHKKSIAALQGIGIERDATGIPVVRVPSSIINDSKTDPQAAEIYSMFKKIATNLRRDEQHGLVLPSDCDEITHKPLYDLQLLSTAGTRAIDTQGVLDGKNKEIAISLMVDIILMGHEAVGSYALADSKTNLLSYAMGGILGTIQQVYNRHLIPRLARLNGFHPDTMPKLTHGDIESVNLDVLANFVSKISTVYDISDLENEVRRRSGFPLREEDDMEDEPPMPPRLRQPDEEEQDEKELEEAAA